MIKKNYFKAGFTVLEMLIYIFILTLTTYVVVVALSALTSSYRNLKNTLAIENTAQVALERINREARDATSIDVTNSTLGVSPGILTLNTLDSGGVATTIRFELIGGRVHATEASTDIGPLSPELATVTNLVFRRISTTNSEALKIELTVESGVGTTYKSKKFYSTVVLRGSYAP